MEFKTYGRIPRLSKEMVITEKIDGTNACVVITEDFEIFAQSRNRIITPQDDNMGFAQWVENNRHELIKLWVGYHYWEWFGGKIQRGYGIKERRFALFFFKWEELPKCCEVVPVLYTGEFDTEEIKNQMRILKEHGSFAVEGFMNPEGIVIHHTAAKQLFKKTFESDKWKFTIKN